MGGGIPDRGDYRGDIWLFRNCCCSCRDRQDSVLYLHHSVPDIAGRRLDATDLNNRRGAAQFGGASICPGGAMKTATVVGILLIILAVISFVYQGITYTTHKKVLDLGPVQASTTQHKTIPLSPVFGGILLVGGIVLVIVGGRNKS